MAEPIHACMRCGGRGLNRITIQAEGPEMISWVCAECEWQGNPVTFDEEHSYQVFLKGLKAALADDWVEA